MTDVIDWSGVCGSSPHTRGAPDDVRFNVDGFRIIPAYAGSTVDEDGAAAAVEDHPRIRGEHGADFKMAPQLKGSSPHTRGAPRRIVGQDGAKGIIPAYAGSTSFVHTDGILKPDHPRIRGEHYKVQQKQMAEDGSSPHTRGALRLHQCPPPDGPDHPRIRGEHPYFSGSRRRQSGSSPHTRGALKLSYL